ncbi:MAG: hypothetical protein IT200_07230 [Thermoleophilia bacterium]|nr:hypothetical protein [Thermoleophilia bacterium]
MDARTLKGYAGAVTALAVTGGWFAISGNPFPGTQAAPAAPPAATAATTVTDPAVRRDLALARAYRRTAAQVRGDTAVRVEAAANATPRTVTITQAAPVAATRSS